MTSPGWPLDAMQRIASSMECHNKVFAEAARFDQLSRTVTDSLNATAGMQAALSSFEQRTRALAEMAHDRLSPAIEASMAGSPALQAALAEIQRHNQLLAKAAKLDEISRAVSESPAMQSLLASIEQTDRWVVEMARLDETTSAIGAAAARQVAHVDAFAAFARSDAMQRVYDDARRALLRDDDVLRRAIEEAGEPALDAAAAFTCVVLIALIYLTQAPTRAAGLLLLLVAEAWRDGVLGLELIGALQDYNDLTKGLMWVLQMAVPVALVKLSQLLREGGSPSDGDDGAPG